MVYDADFREAEGATLETAIPLINIAGAAPGNFVVPTNARTITELRFALGMSSADDTLFGMTSSFHLHGGGLPQLGEGWFLGPTITSDGLAAASGNRMGAITQKYLTNIPVSPGAQFTVDAYMLGEDIGGLVAMAQVVYDGPVVGRIVDMDYRSIDLATAEAWTQLTERGAAVVEGDIRPHKPTIGELYFGVGTKTTVGAANVTNYGFRLSGPGLVHAGNYRFIIGSSIGSATESGSNTKIAELERYICHIPVKLNNPVRVEGIMIGDDVGTGFSVCGFAYY